MAMSSSGVQKSVKIFIFRIYMIFRRLCVIWGYVYSNFAKIYSKKFGSKEKSATFALPIQKRGISETGWQQQVHWKDWIFILYKKQVPRNTNLSRSVNSFV